MDEVSAERMRDVDLRKYGRELSLAPAGLKKTKLLTRIVHAKMDAEYYGWGKTVGQR
jgi:hypothetical protein